MSTKVKRFLRLVTIILPPVALGITGLFHPHQLTVETAKQWTLVHVVLLPLFPLLGLSYHLILARYRGLPIYFAKICIYIYIIFYTALDTIAGIANGVVISRLASMPDTQTRAELIRNLRQSLYISGNYLGNIGVYALIGIAFFTYISFFKKKLSFYHIFALVSLVTGTALFAYYHLYAPWGVVAMFILAISLASLEIIDNKIMDKK